MKTTKYIYNFKTLLVFVANILIFSCSSNNEESKSPTYETTPGQAALVVPSNNEQCEVGEVKGDIATVSFTWDASEATEKYDLEIINLETNEITRRLNLPDEPKTVRLSRGYPYSWKITSKNSGEVTTDSQVWKFYVAGDGETNSAPFPASLLSPSSGAIVSPINNMVTLEWDGADPDNDNISYTVFVDTIDGKQDPPEEWQDITNNSINISVNPGTIYYWHIETSDGANTSVSKIYTFKTAN